VQNLFAETCLAGGASGRNKIELVTLS
jgi:hypothetical protein